MNKNHIGYMSGVEFSLCKLRLKNTIILTATFLQPYYTVDIIQRYRFMRYIAAERFNIKTKIIATRIHICEI